MANPLNWRKVTLSEGGQCWVNLDRVMTIVLAADGTCRLVLTDASVIRINHPADDVIKTPAS
jgi:hypothetical protein